MEPLPSKPCVDATQCPPLSEDERRLLSGWMVGAREIGIDAVEDLCARPWPVPTDAKILGVFRGREALAEWLLVGHGGRWAVASCTGQTVLGSTDCLAEALSLILRAGTP